MVPLGLMQLAGRQLMPNVQLALPLLRRGWLAEHVVLHTDDVIESRRPAAQLVGLLGDAPGADAVSHSLCEVDADAEMTYRSALAEIDERPAQLRWILNVTGGTKMMALGLAQLARHPRVLAALYRELGPAGTWQRLRLDEGGSPRSGPLPAGDPLAQALGDAASRLDSLPLLSLLESQLAAADATAGDARLRPTGRVAMGGADVCQWLHEALAPDSCFRRARPSSARLAANANEGVAFECWLAHTLAALGTKQVCWNVTAPSRSGSMSFEVDVVACHGNELLFADLKLVAANSPKKTAEIRTARKTAEVMGGLGVRSVVVRPNWRRQPMLAELAQALRVELLTREDLPELVPRLAGLLKLPGDPAQRGEYEALRRLFEHRVAACRNSNLVFAHG